MEIIEYFETEDEAYWLEEIKKSDWGAGQYLYKLLREDKLREFCGKTTLVYLLTETKTLVSFCTIAEQDEVRDLAYTPWIGFVYTFPEFRGHRYMEQLIEKAEEKARSQGEKFIYISTGEIGLYEKYGYSFYKIMKDMGGEETRVYRKAICS